MALVLTAVGWVFGNPPTGGPDELAHYVKALGVAGGDPNGREVGQRAPTGEELENLAALGQSAGKAAPLSAEELRRRAWMDSQTREFTIPAALGVNIYCAGRGEERLTCLRELRPKPAVPHAATPMGTYLPVPYLLPGLAAREASDPEDAIRLARLASALICFALLGLAVVVLARGEQEGRLSTLGMVVAISPAVVLSATTINPSGPEVAGAICFLAGLLSVTRPDGRWWAAWTAVGAGGACLAASRSFGPLFVGLALLFVALLAGRTGVSAALARPRAPLAVTLSLATVAAAINIVWELTQQPHPEVARSDLRPGISDAWEQLPDLGEQAVGVFGRALDIPLPTVLYVVWAVLTLGVVGWAVRLGDRRELAVLLGTASALLSSVFILSIAVRPTGFTMQARHVLPLAVLLPIGAGEVLRRHVSEISAATARRALLAAIASAAAVHVAAWYVNARVWSGGPDGPGFLFSRSAWSPPLSWIVWAGALLVAAAAVLGGAWLASSDRSPTRAG